jgi:hypothetical protein
LTSIDIAFWAVYGRSLKKEISIIAFFALILALKRKKGTHNLQFICNANKVILA